MTSTQSLPIVQGCSVSSCAYNEASSCHAGAITIADDKCGTFVEISLKAGVDAGGVVGACHRSECKFNDKLECTAASVEIGQSKDVADCLTYEAR